MSDFALVVVIVGAMLLALAAAVVLEWRGFQQAWIRRGQVTISAFVFNGLGKSRKTVSVASFIAGAAFVHFLSGG